MAVEDPGYFRVFDLLAALGMAAVPVPVDGDGMTAAGLAKLGFIADLSNKDKRFDDLAAILFDQAMLAEGGQLEDPAAYVRRVNALLLA